ncbi:MAG: hypothetical protein IJ841_02780 [Prevotella sp.]|nr:hypothetical protein [Prevotella sp.]
MGFALICIVSIVALGAVAAIASMLTKGGTDEPIALGEDCSTCSSHADGTCQIACLMDEKRKKLAEKQ